MRVLSFSYFAFFVFVFKKKKNCFLNCLSFSVQVPKTTMNCKSASKKEMEARRAYQRRGGNRDGGEREREREKGKGREKRVVGGGGGLFSFTAAFFSLSPPISSSPLRHPPLQRAKNKKKTF